MDEILARQMYQEHILDLYKNPHNFGSLKNATNSHSENNPLCGDEVTVQLVVKNNKVEEVKFLGRGCAISMASASLLTDKIKDMSVEDVKRIKAEDMLELLNIPIGPVRMKCALLSLETLQKAIK